MEFEIIKYKKLKSTQDTARAINKPYTIIFAEEMTAGRGRMQREWVAGKGGLWITVTMPLTPNTQLITLAAGVAVSRTFEELGLRTCLKWPNDVMIDNLKIAGILCESSRNLVYVGIGVNLNNQLPPELEGYATTAKKQGLNTTVDEFLSALIPNLAECKKSKREVIRAWKKHQCTLGRKIKVIDGNNEYECFAENLDEDGFLIVKHNNQLKKIIAGDIRFIQTEDESRQSL